MKKIIIAFAFLAFAVSLNAQWVQQVNPLDSTLTGKIQFVSSTEGWISLENGKLLHTTNSGNNWLVVTPEPIDTLFSFSDPAFSLSFINPSTGWIICTKGSFSNMQGAVVYKTVNSGVNWSKVTIPAADAGIFIQFVDASNGWILIFNQNFTGGGLFRTTNGGTNWNAIYPPVGGFPFFINSNTGWLMPINSGSVSTTSDTIRKTTNGGVNWFAPWGTNSQVSFNSIYFSDPNNGCAVGKNGLILKTTNGGISWNNYTNAASTSFYNLSTVFILNTNTVWIGAKQQDTTIGQIASIVFTSNGGTSWTFQPVPINNPPENNKPFSIHFFNEQIGGFTADMGKICHTSNGGVRVTNISTEIPSMYSLSQNYPNPFNPTTKIQFQVPSSKFIKIVVFDILGKEVETLVNESLQPGTYEITFDASKLTSGVYFYKIVAGDFVETRKMLMIK